MTKFTKEQLIEDLKASTQNASGMFEISDDTICALMYMLTNAAPYLPQPAVEEIAMQNFRTAMEGIGHIRRTLDETFGGLHGTHCEPDVLVECKAICDAIYEAYRKSAPVTCRAAMLQGADGTLTNEGTIPVTQFKPVADLYGLTSPTGGETSFTFDAVEARDFIDGGWLCQEYVELERFQEAITNHTEDKLAMVDHSGDSNNMVEPVTTACKLPSQSSDAVNEAAWKLHDTLTEHGPLNGHQFNNLKGCFYEALKVAMCNSPVIPEGWISCSERMPDNDEYKPIAIFTGKCLGQGMFVATYDDDGFFDFWEGMEIIGVTHWMTLPAAPQQEVK